MKPPKTTAKGMIALKKPGRVPTSTKSGAQMKPVAMIAMTATTTETASSAGSATAIRSRAIHHATSSAISPEKKAEVAAAAALPKSTRTSGVRESTTCWSVPPNSSCESDQPIWKSERFEVVSRTTPTTT